MTNMGLGTGEKKGRKEGKGKGERCRMRCVFDWFRRVGAERDDTGRDEMGSVAPNIRAHSRIARGDSLLCISKEMG